MLVPIKKMNFVRGKFLTPDFFLKQSDLSLLAKNRVLRLIVYLNESNTMVVIKLSVESNITGIKLLRNNMVRRKSLKHDIFLKQSVSNLLVKNKFSTLIVYLIDSNIRVVIKLSVESNITRK